MRHRILGGAAAGVAILAVVIGIAVGGVPFAAGAAGGRAKLFASAPQCKRGQLALNVELGPPAMGNAYVMYVLRNRSRFSCSVGGTPRLTILHAKRRAAPATVVHAIRTLSVRPVTLAPRQVASFIVDAKACEFDPSVTAAAPTVTQITLPGQSKAFSFSSPATTQCARQELAIGSIRLGQSDQLSGWGT